ncbi:anhydro-N-acetylmuramic acid kinase [Nakamurella endophytica]|uniref:Anhydro-N-acetylmuramic acid kinase n=1 Tax=Nakamurella endophytica TaxID=1748367 RepID=A0A917SKK1_9ACTN|nr:anhydro-N-acetylmuramic acid kinase [Nakamurella endophytica]GGL86651.1 anhydro-N-acetylmuramic acid kinase [Nakamurella endophytica]
MTVIGLMSGTSYDAVDAAVAELWQDGADLVLRPLGLVSRDVPDELRGRIAAALPPASTSMADVCRLDTEIGRLFGSVATEADDRVAGGRADLVVSHGQTVYHWVEDGRALGTLQLGAAAWIAEATGRPVVSDLRTRDITRGGQAAPLASTLDALLLLSGERRRGALNLGGIANISVRSDDGAVLAYDLGPASALMDSAVSRHTGGAERMDTDGRRAAAGRVDHDLLSALLAEPYYAQPIPKSTGKELFHPEYVPALLAGREIAVDDLVATLTELTAVLVAEAARRHRLDELVVSGGGVRNPVLMARIAALSAPAEVRTVDDVGIPAQAKEAYLFAVLGWLTVHGLPGTIPSATGASAPSVLGSITPGAEPLRLPEPAPRAPARLVVQR